MKLKKITNITIMMIVVTILGGCSNREAKKIYEDGKIKFAAGAYVEASVSFEKALELNQDRSEYFLDYGMSLAMIGEYEKAYEVFEGVLRTTPNDIVRKYNQLAYRGMGITKYLTYDYENALVQFQNALDIETNDPVMEDIKLYMASSFSKLGKYEEAISIYTNLVGSDIDSTIYNDRAYAYAQLGNHNKALEDYEKAISLDKSNYEYYLGKYFLQMEMGQEPQALNTLKDAQNLDFETKEDKYNLARIHYYMGQDDIAKIEFTEAIKNGFAKAYYYLGNINEKQEDYEEALKNYTLFLEDPTTVKNATVYNQVGLIQMSLNNYEEAAKLLRIGKEFNNLSIDKIIRKNYIIALEGSGDFETAYNEVQEYVKRYPEDQEAIREVDFIKSRVENLNP